MNIFEENPMSFFLNYLFIMDEICECSSEYSPFDQSYILKLSHDYRKVEIRINNFYIFNENIQRGIIYFLIKETIKYFEKDIKNFTDQFEKQPFFRLNFKIPAIEIIQKNCEIIYS